MEWIGLEHRRRPKTGPAIEKLRKLQIADIEKAIDALGSVQEAILELYDVIVTHIPAHEIQPRGGQVSPDGTYTPQASWAIPTSASSGTTS